ncbi:UDP-N-acetylglucosamine transferase subunit ALG14 [Schistosoma japonicum]|nr:UDP-N-acetylglucosamine transferase subunit ALG14 [Schistosoma japonicum]
MAKILGNWMITSSLPKSICKIAATSGHTAEMLSYVSVLTPKYQPRTYVIAATDSISEQKVFNLEDKSDIKRFVYGFHCPYKYNK